MWFKNLQIYKILNWNFKNDDLELALSKAALQPCNSMETNTKGWLPPKDGDNRHVYPLGKCILISLGSEKKLLPTKIINQHLYSKSGNLESAQGYKLSRKQIKKLKEEITFELLPKAFSIRNKTYALIDQQDGWLVINSPSRSIAEEIPQMLRKLGLDFSLDPVINQLSPSAAMTKWLLTDDVPSCLSIDQNYQLRDSNEEKATIRYTSHSPDPLELKRHINNGKTVVKLSLTWRNRISFSLDEKFQIKQLNPLDFVKEQNETIDLEDIFDSDLFMMIEEFKNMIPDLIKVTQKT